MKVKRNQKTRRLWPFAAADFAQAAAYLEKQAEKGLILEKLVLYDLVAVFRKDRPQKRKFCVDGFKGEESEAIEYLDMAEDAGWTAAAVSQGLVIFMSEENASPTPMQTDWEMEYRWIRKGLWKFDIPMGIVGLLALAFLFWISLSGDPDWPMDWYQALNLLCMFFVIILSLLGFVRAVWFYMGSGRALRTGRPMQKSGGTMRQAMLWGYSRSAAGLAWIVVVIGKGLSIMVPDISAGGAKAFWLIAMAVCMVLFFIITRLSWERRPELGKGLIVVMYILIMMALLGYCASGCEVTIEG